MNCTNCSANLTENDLFCGDCGTRVTRQEASLAAETAAAVASPTLPPSFTTAAESIAERKLERTIPLPPPPRRASASAPAEQAKPAIPTAQRETPPIRPAAPPPIRTAAGPAVPPPFQAMPAAMMPPPAAMYPGEVYPAAKKGGFLKTLVCLLVLGQAVAIAFFVFRPDQYFFSTSETDNEDGEATANPVKIESKSSNNSEPRASENNNSGTHNVASRATDDPPTTDRKDDGEKTPGGTTEDKTEPAATNVDIQPIKETETPATNVDIQPIKSGELPPTMPTPWGDKTEMRQELKPDVTKPEDFPFEPSKGEGEKTSIAAREETKTELMPAITAEKPAETKENADDLISLGRAYQDKGELKGAYEYLLRATELAPSSASAQLHMGKLLRDMGHSDEALSYLRRAVELDPNSAEAANELGAHFVNLGNTKDAILTLNRAIELSPQWAPAYNNLGAALVARFRGLGPDALETGYGDLEWAIKCFHSAATIDPNQPKYAENLKQTEAELEQFIKRHDQPAEPAWTDGPGMDELPPAGLTDPPGEGFEEEYEEEYSEDPSDLPPPAPAPSN